MFVSLEQNIVWQTINFPKTLSVGPQGPQQFLKI